MAEPTGLEPATSGVTVRCANQLHYGSAVLQNRWIVAMPGGRVKTRAGKPFAAGGRCRTRTSDILRVRQALYRLS